MSKDDMEQLMLGAVIAVLGYALYKHFNPSSAGPAPTSSLGVAVGEVASNGNTGPVSPFTMLENLLTGTVHDIGGFDGTNWLAQIEGRY